MGQPIYIFLKRSFYSFSFFFSILILSSSDCISQSIIWNFDGGTGTNTPSVTAANVSASALTQQNNYGSTEVLTNVSSSAGYVGASGNYNAGAASVSAPFDAATSTYFEFTLTPEQGYLLKINSINFGSRSTATGPQSYTIRASIDSYTSNLSGNSFPADSKWYWYQNTGLAISSTSAMTFRIYGFNGVNAVKNTAVWRVDDLSVNVTVSSVQTYYRSRQSGNWSSASTWEYSTDNVTWNVSSKSPTSDGENILIQEGHTVTVATSVTLDQTIIRGTLELQTGGVLNINNGAGDDITIPSNGILKIISTQDYLSTVQQAANANINVSGGGKIIIGDGSSSTGNGYEAFATSTVNVWNDGAIYEYNVNKTFSAAGLTYFPNADGTTNPIFRVSTVSGTPGSGSSSVFIVNGILEINCDLTLSGTGDKYFRNGIKGNYTLTQTGSGQVCLNGLHPVLDGNSLKIILKYNLQLYTNTEIPSGSNVIVSGSNISNNVISGTVLTINGTLDVTDQGVKNTSGFIILNGTFRTANSGGFSGSKSSIPSGGITVNSGSIVELYALGDQSINPRTDFKNLIFSGRGVKTPNGPFSPNGTLTIKDEAVFDCTGNLNGTNIGNNNTNLTMTGNSRLIVSSVGPNPPMAGSYNLSGGVIEFRGSNGTPQTIRSKSYQNIEVTGSNVLMSGGNISLNTSGTFTVKSGGKFFINDNTITGTGDRTQTITVEGGAIFSCGTNRGFNGFTITSAPIKSSAINSDIQNIVLQPNSTVDYSRSNPPLSDGDQPITNANGLIYQNLVISGSGNKTAPSDNLIIQGNLTKSGTATFVHNNGTVIFNGTKEQIYSSNSPVVFNNLTNDNKTSLSIKDSLSVYNQLSLRDNSVTTLDADISLLSSKNNTASVGRLSVNANINYNAGRFIVERYINTTSNGGHQKSWQLLSTPAFGETVFDTWQEKGSTTISGYGTWITGPEGTAKGFDAASSAPSMKYYAAATNSWVGISETDMLLQNEKGYMIFVRGDRLANSVNSSPTPTVLRTRGKLYTPEFLPPVTGVPAGKFQCVGNPYPSAIDFSKLNFSNIQNSYIAWDPTLGGSYGFGGYQTITKATGFTAVPGNTQNYNSTDDYRFIQSGQAFFVSNYTEADGVVSFSEDCKVSGNYHMVNRESGNSNRILFANLVSKNGIVVDGNAVSFSSQFSNKIDGDDAIKFATPGESFAIKRMDRLFTVEARDEIDVTDTIFYALKNLIKQDYTIIFYSQNLRPGLDAYLIDAYLKTEKQISVTDSSVINFSVTDDKASSHPDRFSLVFRAAAGPLTISVLSMNACPKNGNVFIEWKVGNENEVRDYEVEYSADGIHFTQIGAVSASDGLNKNYNFTHFQPNSGNAFYRIKINKINGESAYQKVLKVIVPSSISIIRIFPNPVKGKVINLQFVKQPVGRYRFVLNNSLGQKVFSKEINYKGEANLSLNSMLFLTTGVYQLQIIKPNGERELLKVKSE